MISLEPCDDPDEEFFDCISDVKYCAIASPQGAGHGEVYMDFEKAQTKWKQMKGSRMKIFSNFAHAQDFASTPVKNAAIDNNAYPPSPKPDIEATPFSSASQSSLLQLRGYTERGDLDKLRRAIDENPMLLVTASDTPTLLQRLLC
ncbi:hypothetical protein PHET_12212 [Paragonimus heterotremus]|uniref:Uncharacterized protein n=1 Tax=Paragonimus heterotremus TaxID=100268 RepID=A0A8J4SSS9_9TREM|nr:hypothetical protein PHET_12212 [Paragonimus heterotremus]